MMFVMMNYIDFYGDDFLGLMDTQEDALEILAEDYVEFGDTHTTNDIDTVLFLENCFELELDTNI